MGGESRLRRLAVPAVPAALSLVLSFSTVGSDVYWQDSGFYLTAVHDFSVLYPPGFVVYLILARLWTALFFFLDFTLAVHLFSSACAATAAAFLAVAARSFLSAREGLLRGTDGGSDALAPACATVTGCLASAGFTFWFSGIYAKGYSFYFLVLALLLWRMVRASESGRPRDWTCVALLIGLAWQAHPSSALLGPALLLFVILHRKRIGTRCMIRCVALAAAVGLLPSMVILPILAARDSITSFGNPASPGELLAYLTGSRFTTISGAFGWDGSRVVSAGLFFWEEFLGVGVVLVAAGLACIARVNWRLLLGLGVWIVPVLVVTVLFKIEGQQDLWFVAAWLPLHLVGAAGLCVLGGAMRRGAVPLVVGLAVAGIAWAVLANYSVLNFRGYDLASRFGQVYLDRLEPDALLVVSSDDSAAICQYLTLIRGHRSDVTVVRASRLGHGHPAPGWYDLALKSRDGRIRLPDHEVVRRAHPRLDHPVAAAAAFVRANAGAERPVYLEQPLPDFLLSRGFVTIPSGTVWKVVPRRNARVDPGDWEFPVGEEEVLAKFGRARGQDVKMHPGGIMVRPEAYERRLLIALLRARKMRADWLKGRGDAAGARRDYEAILRYDPETAKLAEVIFPLGEVCLQLNDQARAATLFQRTLELDAAPRQRASAYLYLGLMLRSAGRETGALKMFEAAASVPGLDEVFLREMERRAKKP